MKKNLIIEKTACFIGHRKIEQKDILKERLTTIIEDLILNKKVDTFLFGSHSDFDDLCLEVVTELKNQYAYITRIYARTQYPELDDYNYALFTKYHDDTYYPPQIKGAGKYVYVERNYDIIDKSRFCVFYYDENITLPHRKSGTKIAYEYAKKKKKEIINIFYRT